MSSSHLTYLLLLQASGLVGSLNRMAKGWSRIKATTLRVRSFLTLYPSPYSVLEGDQSYRAVLGAVLLTVGLAEVDVQT